MPDIDPQLAKLAKQAHAKIGTIYHGGHPFIGPLGGSYEVATDGTVCRYGCSGGYSVVGAIDLPTEEEEDRPS